MVALGDSIIETPGRHAPGIVTRLIEAFEAGAGVCAAIAVETVPDADVHRYGIVAGELRDGVIEATEVLEKPDPASVRSRHAIAARYVVGPSVLAELRETAPGVGGEVQVADALTRRLAAGERVLGVPLAPGERRHDIGTVQAYCTAFLRYAFADPRFGAELRAHAAVLLAHDGG